MICSNISENYIHRPHVESKVKLHVSREAPFPLSLKFNDVITNTSTSLDVVLERSNDDYLNVDRTDTVHIRCQTSLRALCWRDTHDLGEPLKRKQTTSKFDPCEQKYGKTCQSVETKKEVKVHYRKNRSLTMRENYDIFISIIQRIMNSRKLLEKTRKKLEVPMSA